MPIKLGVKPYRFDLNNSRQHHFGRCYISDIKVCHMLLRKLYEYKRLKISDIPAIYPTSRGEMSRELFIELWRIGLPVGIEKLGASSYAFCYIGEEPPPSIESLTSIIKEKRSRHPYTLIFLDVFRGNEDGLTEIDMVKFLFNPKEDGSYAKGCNDQVHPTMNDLKNFGLTTKLNGEVKTSLTEEGLRVIESDQFGITFICFSLDFNGDKFCIRLMWSILKSIQNLGDTDVPYYPYILDNPPYLVQFSKILAKHNGAGLGTNRPLSSPDEIAVLLDDLNVSFNYDETNEVFEIKERLFFSITPKDYVSNSLSLMDNVVEFINTNENLMDKEISTERLSSRNWFITENNEIDPILSDDYSVFSFSEWQLIKDNLPELQVENIVIGEIWNPIHLETSCGELYAFVKNGGNLYIHGPQGGRIGSNKQFYNWLPSDFERLNYMPDSKKWSFDLNRLPGIDVGPIYCESLMDLGEEASEIKSFYGKYYNGNFIFLGPLVNETNYDVVFNKYRVTQNSINKKSPEWIFKDIPSLYRNPNIKKEENTYPILGKILMDFFGFVLSKSFSHSWEGEGSVKDYVDLCTIFPSITLWEVDSIKGKSGYIGFSGDSLAIDQGHATKVEPYRKRAEKQFNRLLKMIETETYEELDVFQQKILEEISKLQTNENFQMKEVFEVYLEKFIGEYNNFDSVEFIEYLNNLNSIIKQRPTIALLGVSYGFPEGQKYSAREYSIDEEYSLWSYRDLYELLVRTYHLSKENRRVILLNILSKNKGPVCYDLVNNINQFDIFSERP